MNRKFVIVVIAIVFGIILYFTIMKLEYENNIEQMSNFFNVTIINCEVIDSGSKQMQYRIKNNLDKDYQLKLSFQLTDRYGVKLVMEEEYVDIFAGQTAYGKKSLNNVPQINICAIQIKESREIP